MEEETNEQQETKQQTSPQKPKGFARIKAYFAECGRVLRVTKKPTGEEFKAIVKVSGIGMLLIGSLGFVIHMIKVLLFK